MSATIDSANSPISQNSTDKAYAQGPLMVFLLDSAIDFTPTQKELLALALHLRLQGFEPYIACPNNCKLMQKAKEQDLPTIAITSVQGGKPGIKALMRLFFKQKRKKALCIHTFAENCMPLAKRIANIRIINSTIILNSCFNSPTSAVKALPAYWSSPDKIIYPSKYVANTWAKVGVQSEQAAVIHTAKHALNANKDEVIKRWIFIAFEQLEQGTGVDCLLKAMSALWQHPHLPEWEVRIVGSGSFFQQLFNEAQALGVASRLSLLGDQCTQNVLQHAHILISPNMEPQGNMQALMIAWSAAMPLICTTVNAHMEVANINNAFLVTEADPQRLAAAMIELMCRPERMNYFCDASAKMQTFAQTSRLQEQYFTIYQDCIARRGWALPVKSASTVSEAN